jgi:tRNA:m4X modification enzyme
METTSKNPKKMKVSSEKIQEPDDKPQCHFMVIRKNRLCKMIAKAGQQYCGEHQPPVIVEPIDESRILCPLDRTHSVMKFKLEKHLLVCNARKKENNEPYVKKNLNIGMAEACDDGENFKLRDLPQDELDRVTKLVNDLFAAHVDGKIATEIMTHEIFDEEMKAGEYGDEKLRHLLQASSILGILKDRRLLEPKTCFIDLGAGKGHLSYWLTKLIVDDKTEDSKVLVVDRASHRHKRDNLFKELGEFLMV